MDRRSPSEQLMKKEKGKRKKASSPLAGSINRRQSFPVPVGARNCVPGGGGEGRYAARPKRWVDSVERQLRYDRHGER